MTDTLQPLKLLAIDDTAENLELIKEALVQDGLEILTAGNAEAGLQVFLRNRPQIVLLDLIMPNVNGMELLWSKNSDVLKRREFLSVLGYIANSLPQALAA